MSGGGGFRGQKRKRNWDTDCPSFPGESPLQSSRVGLGTVRTAALSEAWLRCGEGFLDTSMTQLPTEEKAATEKHLELCPRSNKAETVASKSVSGLAEITWSSSGSDLSDEDKALSKSQRANEHDSKIDRFSNSDILCSEDEACEDELQFIDWEIDSDREETSEHRTVEEEEGENAVDISDSASCASSHSLTGEETLPACPKTDSAEILEYSSDSEREDNFENVSLIDSESSHKYCVDFGPDGRQSMEKVKSMETTLYTPQKQTKFSRTPEKAKKKLLRGGLAERMSGLQNRERSAISLWRHQCASYQQTLSGRKSGMLIVKILELQEECNLQVAMCEQLEGPQAHNPCQGEAPSMKVLFTKETAGHLKAHLQDIIYIYPPWQKLIIPNHSCPIILNTYFCKKVAAKELSKPVQEVHYWDTLLPRRSITLAQMFRLKSATCKPPQSQAVCGALASMGKDWAPEHQEAKQLSSTRIFLRDSLLDAVESQGAASWSASGVRVVVQRVYCLPVRCQQGAGPTALPSSDAPRTRVCLLVQDAYGMFSEVHTEGTIWNNQQLEGKSCSLTGVKVLQKATRGRTAGLFSLIDSLWPPAEPLRAPGPYLVCGEENTHLPPPSFCYILTTHPDLGRIDVTEDPISKFYQPPVTRSLRDVLQTVHPGTRCCFYAQVIYQRPQLSSLLLLEQREIWLTVTDVTLQTQGEDDAGLPHTMLVCVTSGCVLAPDVQEALTEAAPHNFLFRDALRDQGWLVCAERTVLLLQKPLLGMDTQTGSCELTGSPRLDELGPNTQVNSICSVQGTVVGVDESTAFSWPTCNLCGNGRLEQNPEDRGALSCRDCSCVVTSPLLRRHLQVFLHCPLCPQSTVKVKLLQASISSLLRSAACEDGTYEVQSVLGKEVGLQHCFVQSIATHPAHCITLEEIELLKAGRASVESHPLPRDP